jgi:aspartyl-tRNA(Asn)/glutamyl-tRNA(Gln) amidotransferase subunit C
MEQHASPMAAENSNLTLEQVRHIAMLARLELTTAEEQAMLVDLQSILHYIAKLEQLDTNAIAPTAQVGDAGTPMRDDIVTNEPAPEAVLANAPARQDQMFRVPKIIE